MSEQRDFTLRHGEDIVPFTGSDGAVIRELAGRGSGLVSHSLAAIKHPAGTATRAHHHHLSDEVYYVVAGQARLLIAGQTFTMGPGDVLQIPAEQEHKLWNNGPEDLELIVSCAPAYSTEDVYWDEA